MERSWFFSRDVAAAREEILEYLRDSPDLKVIYFDGWHGFGVSAVLRSVAQVLHSEKASPELSFDRIIYIDCSCWKSRRATQRAIAEELKLDGETMALFDKQDEEDDFRALDQGSRDVITSVAAAIDKTLRRSRFIIIFLNGSDDEMDMSRFGIRTFEEYDNNRMIWTFRTRFLTVNREYSDNIADKLRHTHLFIKFFHEGVKISSSEFCALLREEADTIISRYPSMTGFDTTMVVDCCLYELFLRNNFHTATKFGWASHASNYWICDGIIQGNIAKDISSALEQEISRDRDDSSLDTALIKEFMKEPPFMVVKDDNVYGAGQYRWISITSKNTEVSSMQSIPAVTSSFFLTFEIADHSKPKALLASFFRHSSNLGVLVLCYCGYDFASPPFLICHGLKFLGLDRCTNDSSTCKKNQHVDWTALSSLYVLDLRHTEWDEIMSQEKIALMYNLKELNIVGFRCWQHYARKLQGQLPCLRRLRVVRPTQQEDISTDTNNSFVEKIQLEVLDLSGDTNMKTIPNNISNVDSLLVLIVDGCNGLKNVIVPDGVSPSLTSFSFDGYGPASHWASTAKLPQKEMRPFIDNKREIKTCKISLKGCTRLENLFLRQLPNLVELDLSKTAIKILDFTSMVVEVSSLKRLFLLECEQLRAIKWENSGSKIKPDLELLCIDTRPRIKYPQLFVEKNKSPGRLSVHAAIVDARIARSLWALINGRSSHDVDMNIHVTSSMVYDEVQSEGTYKDNIGQLSDHVTMQQQDLISAGQYHDVLLSMVGDAPMQSFPLPPTTMLSRHIEIAQGSHNLESELDINSSIPTLAHLASQKAESLHVHDLSTSTCMPGEEWAWIRWCRIERCPKIETVFPEDADDFDPLETMWVSDLLMARCIWSKCSRGYPHSFEDLQHLHLRSCPRLQFVLPVRVSSVPNLKTLHVIHCSDLRNIFVLDEDYPEEITVKGVAFRKLTTIHLHDLPMLRQICDVEFKMVVPALETIKIRGCWGLRRLPTVAARGRKPAVEIEEDVWNALEWDGVEAGHHPSLFQTPVHSRYYKKKLPRGSVLR